LSFVLDFVNMLSVQKWFSILDIKIERNLEKMSNSNIDDFQRTQVSESKFWRKFKQDPAVPIGRELLFWISIEFSILRYGRIWFDCYRCNRRFHSTRSKQTNIDILVKNVRLTFVFNRIFVNLGFELVFMHKVSLYLLWLLLLFIIQLKIVQSNMIFTAKSLIVRRRRELLILNNNSY